MFFFGFIMPVRTLHKTCFSLLLLVFIWILYTSYIVDVTNKEYKSNADFGKIKNATYIRMDNTVDMKQAMTRLNTEKVEANSSELIELLRNYYIEHPPRLPYNLDHPDIPDPSPGQTQFVDKHLKHREGGFFVDCGANAGETFSNTLFLERFRNWTGVLIDANPSLYMKLKRKNRKAFTLNACLNDKLYPSLVTFLADSWWGSVLEGNQTSPNKGISGKGRYVQVQCFPLYSILLALNRTRVDYFSLDVEGAELGVLDSIPWDKVDINMISIEYNKWPGGKTALKDYMKQKGYKYMTEINAKAAADIIVMKDKEDSNA